MVRRNSGGRSASAARGASRFRKSIAFGAILAMGPAAARASILIETFPASSPPAIQPIYMNSGGNLGLVDPGSSFNYTASGAVQPLSVQINLQTPVWQNPQDPSNSLNPTPLSTPSGVHPFIADSIWTVTNHTDGTLTHLIFEDVNLMTGGYPDIPVALDKTSYLLLVNGQPIPHLFSIVKYTDSAENTYFFGALSLGSLSPGASTQIDVRYIVTGGLPTSGANLLMPMFDVAGVNVNVPEPGTLVLVATGLALVAASGRRRCA